MARRQRAHDVGVLGRERVGLGDELVLGRDGDGLIVLAADERAGQCAPTRSRDRSTSA